MIMFFLSVAWRLVVGVGGWREEVCSMDTQTAEVRGRSKLPFINSRFGAGILH